MSLYVYSRVGTTPFWINSRQPLALRHKDVELCELLDIVDGELDVSSDVHIANFPAVHGHHTATPLGTNRQAQINTHTHTYTSHRIEYLLL